MSRVIINLLLFFLAAITISPADLRSQQKLTSRNFADFLANFDTNFGLLEGAFRDLASQKLPMIDEQGQALVRRPLADRLAELSDLRQTARQLANTPDDLVLATTLVIHTESLADDLFDLSQIAYDNDREELGNRLSALQATMENDKGLLADYLLALAAQKQERLQQLEKQVEELQQKLKAAAK